MGENEEHEELREGIRGSVVKKGLSEEGTADKI